jgi:hypothetical protein
VKLGNNARDTCAVLTEDYGGDTVKQSSVFEWHKQFKEGHKNMEDDVEVVVQGHKKLMKMLKKWGIWCIQIDV